MSSGGEVFCTKKGGELTGALKSYRGSFSSSSNRARRSLTRGVTKLAHVTYCK